MRCLNLKTSDGPNNHSVPDGASIAARVHVQSRSALTRRRDSESEEQYLKRCIPTVGVWS